MAKNRQKLHEIFSFLFLQNATNLVLFDELLKREWLKFKVKKKSNFMKYKFSLTVT